jgi:hypothetical protein
MAGRKRKQGKRTQSGRLSRSKVELEARFDRGSEWVQAQRAKYGEAYNSALGRAFASGLLGEGNEAKDRYDKARKFISLYRAVIGRDRYRCALDQSPRGNVEHFEPTQRDIDDQEWLLVNMDRIDATGCRPFFDQLTSHLFTDHGPDWLERLLSKPKDRRDTIILDAAIKGIDAIGPVNARVTVLQRRVA